MPHPILQSLDVAHVILQVARRERMPEFVQEEIRTVRAFRAFVAVLRNALPAIQFRTEGDTLNLELVPLVGPPRFIRENQAVCVRFLRGLVLLQRSDQ